jgi:hypothetical protein
MKEKYLPLSYKVRKEHEFLHLKQGHMSVIDFTKKFEELSYYSTLNEYAGNEMWKVNQYKHALMGELYVVASQQRVTDYDEMVHNSLEAERGFDRASGRNRGNFVDKYHDKLKPKGSPQRRKYSGPPRINPTCRKCGKAHQGQCRMGTDNYFACGQAGHVVANCLTRGNKDKGVNTTMSKGRLYSLDGKKAQANEDLIDDTCYLGQHPIKVLFDCGASCSFISFQCVEALQLSVSLLNPPMMVTAATDGGIVAYHVCENCPITVSSKTYYIDLVCLSMKQLDVILGMDWLSANHVYIGCAEKTIYMPTSNTEEGVALS